MALVKNIKDERGFTLMMAIIVILVLSITVPAIVTLSRQEARETLKVRRSSTAFHLAEAGADQGVWKLQESVNLWTNAKTGTAVTDYDGTHVFSMTFADGTGGEYTVGFSPGPGTGEVTVLSKGRDLSTQEARSIQVVMQEAAQGDFAIQSKNTSSFGAATSVEWGPVIARASIDSGGKTHPRLYSAGNITGKDANGSTDPNTDGLQWWSYKQDLPAEPQIDFPALELAAQTAGTSPDAQCGTYYKAGSFNFKGCQDTTGNVFYITGAVDFQSGSGGNYIVGNVIVLGNLNITGNGGAAGSIANQAVPSAAWREYGNDWTYYKTTFDPSCPHATYAAALAAEYSPAGLTYSISDILIKGFIYTGGSQGLTGGGNSRMIGALLSANNTSMTTSNCTLYFDPATLASIPTTNVVISRKSWKEIAVTSWP